MERRLRALGPDAAVLVAEDERGLVVGCASIAKVVTLAGGERAEIQSFVVEKGQRRRGIGTQLLAQLEAWAAERACPLVRLLSNVERDRAHAFYERNGYARVKTEHVFAKPL